MTTIKPTQPGKASDKQPKPAGPTKPEVASRKTRRLAANTSATTRTTRRLAVNTSATVRSIT